MSISAANHNNLYVQTLNMKKDSNLIRVWGMTNYSDKKRIFSLFIKEYGEHYTRDDFRQFLKKRYNVSDD